MLLLLPFAAAWSLCHRSTPTRPTGRRAGACLLTASDRSQKARPPSISGRKRRPSKEGARPPEALDTIRAPPRGQTADGGKRQQQLPYPYLARALSADDGRSYKAAGLLGYRVDESGALLVLLARQARASRSPNMHGSMARVRVGTWNLLGGRRWKDEASAETTAAREAIRLTPLQHVRSSSSVQLGSLGGGGGGSGGRCSLQ